MAPEYVDLRHETLGVTAIFSSYVDIVGVVSPLGPDQTLPPVAITCLGNTQNLELCKLGPSFSHFYFFNVAIYVNVINLCVIVQVNRSWRYC